MPRNDHLSPFPLPLPLPLPMPSADVLIGGTPLFPRPSRCDSCLTAVLEISEESSGFYRDSYRRGGRSLIFWWKQENWVSRDGVQWDSVLIVSAQKERERCPAQRPWGSETGGGVPSGWTSGYSPTAFSNAFTRGTAGFGNSVRDRNCEFTGVPLFALL